jgi:hypothetical protein
MSSPIEREAMAAVGGHTGLEADASAAPAAAAEVAPVTGTILQQRQPLILPASNKLDAQLLDQLLTPFTISLDDWVRGLLTKDEFPESDPDEMAIGMLAQILTAQTSEQALAAMDLDRAKELCGGEPGGRSPVLEITGARPLRSDYEEGPACYCIVDAILLAEGERIRFTTGARAVQAVILTHIANGWLPFRCALEIRREKTRRGYYPLNLVAGV